LVAVPIAVFRTSKTQADLGFTLPRADIERRQRSGSALENLGQLIEQHMPQGARVRRSPA